jgi:hypothetical protein
MGISGSDQALMYALAGVGRAGATRAGYTSPAPYVAIAGVQYAQARANDDEKVLHGSLVIEEKNDTTANTAHFAVKGFQPSAGQDVVVTLGSINNYHREFGGVILSEDHTSTGTPANADRSFSCIDYSWLLGRYRVTARYTGWSATDIAIDLISLVPGYSAARVAPDLPVIEEISFTFDTVFSALTQVAKRITGIFRGCYNYTPTVQLTLTGDTSSPPTVLDTAHPSLTNLHVQRDLSQVITRSFVEGGGSNALAIVGPGATFLPVEDDVWYSTTGGQVVSGPQRITYTGVQDGGGGTLVGPGAAPAAAPVVVLAQGTGIDVGTHQWAVTYVTGAGESLPSPLSDSLVARIVAVPSLSSVVDAGSFSGPTLGVTVSYKLTICDAGIPANETAASAPLSVVSTGHAVNIRWDITSEMVGAYTALYRKDNAGAYQLLTTNGPYTSGSVGLSTGYTDISGSISGSAPLENGLTYQHASLSAITIGPSGTTSRKVYRTAAGGTQLKLLTTIADNVTTVLTDSSADSSLGANVPTLDTSGLTQPDGQVNAGSTSISIAGTGAFSSSGGIAIIGNGEQAIRYTGISGNTLTGVPASGVGSVMSTISYNSSITAAPCLTGIPASGDGAVLYRIGKGDPVNVLAQVDDTTAQAVIAALRGGSDDGVIEDYASDGRISEVEALTRATATLVLHADIPESITYDTRDPNARAGRPQAVDITDPILVNDSFTIQTVTVSNFQPAVFPTRSVSASPTQYGFHDLLRVVHQVTR